MYAFGASKTLPGQVGDEQLIEFIFWQKLQGRVLGITHFLKSDISAGNAWFSQLACESSVAGFSGRASPEAAWRLAAGDAVVKISHAQQTAFLSP